MLNGLLLVRMCVCVSNEDNTKKKKTSGNLHPGNQRLSSWLRSLGYFPHHHVFRKKQIDLLLFEKLNAVLLFPFEISLCLKLVLYAFRSSSVKEGFKRIFLPCSSQTVEQNVNA